MTIDPVNRDLIVVVQIPTGSRLLRLRMSGQQISTERTLADLPGIVTEAQKAAEILKTLKSKKASAASKNASKPASPRKTAP